jgi:HAE1 family hydrophobic/amphiphilic exporter-1
VFIPILFIQQEAGQLFRDIALAISAAVGLSMIVSITVIPVAAARLLGGQRRDDDSLGFGALEVSQAHGAPQSGYAQGNGNGHNGANGSGANGANGAHALGETTPAKPRTIYGAVTHVLDQVGEWCITQVVSLNAFIQRSIFFRLGTVALFVFGSIYLSWVLLPKVEYLPAGNRNLVIGIMLPPPGYNLDELGKLGTQVEQELKPYWDVDLSDPKSKQLGYPAISDFFFVVRDRMVFLGLRSSEGLRAGELVPLVRKVTAKLPGTFVLAQQTSLFERGLGAGRTIDIEITGPDLRKLVGLGGQVLMKVREVVPNAQARPIPSLDLSGPEVHLVPKLDQASDMAMYANELGYTVNALVDGAYATDYYHNGDKIDLTIVGQQRLSNHTHDIRSLPVATPTGEVVTLEHLAYDSLTSGPEQINRRERQRAITISVSPPPEMALEDAMQRIQAQIVAPIIAQGALEGGLYQINLAGTADKLRATWSALYLNLVVALLITYLLMCALFESWLHPFVIILTVPLGAVGGVAALWAMNKFMVLQPLDVVTMLGFIILIGTVVNNPILIVHQALNYMREGGLEPTPAILESVRTRIRPIFMTTTTTVFGLLPLVFMPGAGSELYRGLGAVVLGGLAISTILPWCWCRRCS